MASKHYDALVIGSGAAGSFAAKELTERGLEVLLLEAGPDISEDDFKVPDRPRQKGINLKSRALAVLKGQYIQARIGFYGDQFKHLFERLAESIHDSAGRFLSLDPRAAAGRTASSLRAGIAAHDRFGFQGCQQRRVWGRLADLLR